jgi:hypothetical protein
MVPVTRLIFSLPAFVGIKLMALGAFLNRDPAHMELASIRHEHWQPGATSARKWQF